MNSACARNVKSVRRIIRLSSDWISAMTLEGKVCSEKREKIKREYNKNTPVHTREMLKFVTDVKRKKKKKKETFFFLT